MNVLLILAQTAEKTPSATGLQGLLAGPIPMIDGSTPQCAADTMRAKAFTPRFSASLSDMTTKAAAPSFIPDAFAAVIQPSLANAGRSPEIESKVTPSRIYSS